MTSVPSSSSVEIVRSISSSESPSSGGRNLKCPSPRNPTELKTEHFSQHVSWSWHDHATARLVKTLYKITCHIPTVFDNRLPHNPTGNDTCSSPPHHCKFLHWHRASKGSTNSARPHTSHPWKIKRKSQTSLGRPKKCYFFLWFGSYTDLYPLTQLHLVGLAETHFPSLMHGQGSWVPFPPPPPPLLLCMLVVATEQSTTSADSTAELPLPTNSTLFPPTFTSVMQPSKL